MNERAMTVTYAAVLLVLLYVFMDQRWYVPTAVVSAATTVLGLSKIPIRWVVPRPVRRYIRSRCWSIRNKVYRVRHQLGLY